MKTVWSHIEVLLLCICTMLYGMASYAGPNMGTGSFEMVICSGDGPVSVVVDANGDPVEPRCCDCLTCGAPTTAVTTGDFRLCAAPARFSKLVISITHQIPTTPHTTQPQARGPPSATRKNGVSAMPGCGSIFQDTAA